MNTSKEFVVTILKCENLSHARKIKELLRDSFPIEKRRTPQSNESQTSFSIRVKADSETSIQTAIASSLRKAKAKISEIIWSEPPIYRQFAPPRKQKGLRR
jgi:hypothetical protein